MAPNKSSADSIKNECQIFDCFMEFLRSDLWLIPVNQFVEQRSIVFEREPDLNVVPNTTDCYKGVHSEFVVMVNNLLDAFCEDNSLNKEQVMGALKAQDLGPRLTQKERMRMLLEPIAAAQDFDVFVPMMMRKNIELHLQALKMIEHMKGLLPNSLTLDQEDAKLFESLFEEDESDRMILISVLKQSREEWENQKKMQKDWQAQMEAAIRESLLEKSRLEELRQKEQNLLEEALNKTAGNKLAFQFKNLLAAKAEEEEGDKPGMRRNEPKEVHFIKDKPKGEKVEPDNQALLQLEDKPGTSKAQVGKKQNVRRSNSKEERGVNENEAEMENKNAGKNEVNKGKKLSLGQVHAPPQKGLKNEEVAINQNDLAYRSLLKEREGISADAVQTRMQYLREQRDKLVEKKSREREKQLMAKLINETRPKTAKAARGMMKNGKGEGGGNLEEERRRIAAKIKAEVIDGKK